MRLTDFHSSGTVCSPTRAGLLTGRYQQRAGIEAVIHPVADHPEHRKERDRTMRKGYLQFSDIIYGRERMKETKVKRKERLP